MLRGRWERFLRRHAAAPRPEPKRLPRPLLLVVDDDEGAANALGETIRELGYGALLAGDAAEGVRLARLHLPELLLMDALTPDVDGRHVCRLLQEEAETAATKVVITADPARSARLDAAPYLEFSVDDFLRKPAGAASVRALVERHVPAADRGVVEDEETAVPA
jgi:DNA-binding response OmpR family regulator